ncbi:hypothetical protein EYA84_27900, partial [Verrucosispora sp. SN26_14.1]
MAVFRRFRSTWRDRATRNGESSPGAVPEARTGPEQTDPGSTPTSPTPQSAPHYQAQSAPPAPAEKSPTVPGRTAPPAPT